MVFVVPRLQELARKKGTPSLNLGLVDHPKAYDSVDRTHLWDLLTWFGVPPRILVVIHLFHDGMQACVRLNDGENFVDYCDTRCRVAHG